MWFVTHPHEYTNEDLGDWNTGEVSYETDIVMVWVDNAGFVTPMRLYWRDNYEWRHEPVSAEKESADNCEYRFDVFGDVDPEIDRKMHKMMMEELAPWMPEIPRWLAEAPPYYCCFVPDGNIVVYGELGSGSTAKWRPDGFPDEVESLCRLYSMEGDLLKENEPGQEWWSMYFSGWDEMAKQYEFGHEHWLWEENGIIEIVDDQLNPVAFYSYTGEELPPDTDVEAVRPDWPDLYGRDLPVLYEIQQAARAGRTLARQGK